MIFRIKPNIDGLITAKNPNQHKNYYFSVCDSILNPWTQAGILRGLIANKFNCDAKIISVHPSKYDPYNVFGCDIYMKDSGWTNLYDIVRIS